MRPAACATNPPPDPGYRWTTRKALVVLGVLADLGRVSEAAQAVGMTRQSAYRLRTRLGEHGTFARAWEQAALKGRAQRQARRQRAGKATPLAPEGDIFGLGR